MVEFLKEQEVIPAQEKNELEQTVASIIQQVRNEGDIALKGFLKKFDKVEIDDLKVSEDDVLEAKKKLPATLIEDMAFSIERIRAFAEAQRRTLTEFEQEMIPGVHLGQKVIPIESVGAYVPGGRYPLLSSAQMAIIPAKVAGVSNIRVCTPPTKEGVIHPAVLYAAHQSGADEIFSLGGAQAIAALAYGTETVSPVNKITGPGNRFVTEAKRQVNGVVGIDLLAGPSEVLVLADKTAQAEYVASDLLAQSEHDIDAQGILVTTSRELGLEVIHEIEKQLQTLPTAKVARESWRRRGQVILAESLDEAISITNHLAAEHLHVQVEEAYSHLDKLTNYGSLFLGENASVVFADKVCGTNHILPTNAAAKYTGGVWVGTFLKVVTYQRIENEGVTQLAPHCVRQSNREGLIGHLRSANIRLTGKLDIEENI
ncbi:histidinol dehydrogenase/sulfopropanediol 3-dehydrogenase [Scopulibacillus darangshiensis]|uniref:Histidinol dehydrogenase n=1 Tax=Scopulibacillus darangshiensis TaxID=442528 RepID=A0A4R2NJ19_9BACL|nr:histidinol dehydrogenase [Scopulibacillus darangshiensis]TCP21503.1 histidinol dehydrogenase/sulfopropanediol 3-dehydrogenase [Scopulibacillus darangshiensis]